MRWFAVAVAVVFLTPGRVKAQGKVDLPVSLGELEKRVKADSNDPAAHYNVALGYWNARQWTKADNEFRAAVKLEPRFAAAHLALAYLPMAENYNTLRDVTRIDRTSPPALRNAIEQHAIEFQRAFMIDPMVDMKIIAAGTESLNLNSPLGDILDNTLKAYFQGFIDCEEGRYGDCQLNLGNVIREYGNNTKLKNVIPTNVLWYHGLAAAHQKEYPVAIEDFERLMHRDSAAIAKAEEKDVIRLPIRSAQYRYFIGTFQQAAGNQAEAISDYQQALEQDLSLFMAHVRLADIYQSRKDFEHAIAERQYAVNTNPDDASLDIDLGVTLGLAGKFPDARAALKTAAEALPRSVDAWFWLGIADEQLGQKDEAKAAFQRVVAVAPSRFAARVTQAQQHLARLP